MEEFTYNNKASHVRNIISFDSLAEYKAQSIVANGHWLHTIIALLIDR